jgi:hypothetical protein
MSYIGRGLQSGAFRQLDDISSGFDGSDTTHTMQVNSTNVTVGDVNQILLSLGGVIQKPGTDFTVSSSTLTFTTAPAANTSFFAILLGSDNGGTVTPTDKSVTVGKIDINGGELFLDADDDTSITADTDDQIDIKVGGSDIATLTTSSLTLKNSATADNSTFTLNLQTAESDIAADDVIGKIAFAAPSEGTGTDANLTAAAIQARSEGDFSSSSNATELQFMTGASEAATTKMTLTSSGALGLGTDAPARPLHIIGADGTTSLSEGNSRTALFLDNAGATYINMASANSSIGGIFFSDSDANNRGAIKYNHASDALTINTGATEVASFHTDGIVFNEGSNDQNFRVESNGNVNALFVDANVDFVSMGKNTDDGDTIGHFFGTNGAVNHCRSANNVMSITRNTNDGGLMNFRQGGQEEGSIGVSGSTVTYATFTGSHWSRLADNSKPTILRGTIMDSIDEMCDWYQAVADVAEVKYTAEDQEVIDGDKNVGDVKEKAYTVKENIALPDGKSVGDAVTFTSNGAEYTGVYEKETDVKHVKCKISDTGDSKKAYGVFHCWNDADDGLDGDVNDMEIAQVGTYIIRVNKDVTVEAGDLLVSNGDGTAKLQDDDIIRSKTVAKVNSNVKVETYSDGSYTVPCTLHC